MTVVADTLRGMKLSGARRKVGMGAAAAVFAAGVALAGITWANAAQPGAEPVETAVVEPTVASDEQLAEREAERIAAAQAAQDVINATEAARLAQVEAERVAWQASVDEAARVEAERVAAPKVVVKSTTQAPTAAEPADDGIPAGAWPLPWIASADPQNAQGGNWDFSGCGTGATTFNNVPYCVP